MSKIIEKLVYKRLNEHIEQNSILNNCQFGFRKNSSPLHAIVSTTEYIIKNLDEGKHVVGVFLDLRKAFDVIDHKILLSKLRHYGITEAALRWCTTYLAERKQFTVVNDTNSNVKKIDYGVPQGSILGSLFFLIYINDLVGVSDILKTVLFADDTNLFHSDSHMISLCRVLNQELRKISTWLNCNKLTINFDKTHFLLFSKRRTYEEPIVIFNEVRLKEQIQTKFLGVMMDNKLCWKQHIAHVKTKISRIISILYKIRNSLTTSAKLMLYNSLVLPYLQYCCVAWGSANATTLRPLKTIQKRAIRIVKNANYIDHTLMLFKETKVLKLNDLIDAEMHKFIQKQIQLTNPIIPIQYNHEIHNYNTRQRSNLRPPQVRSNLSRNTVSYKGIINWNNLNPNLKTLLNPITFKINLKKSIINSY